MKRTGFVIAGVAAAGAFWAARRFGWTNRAMCALKGKSSDGDLHGDHMSRGETIYRNTPLAGAESHLGAAGNI